MNDETDVLKECINTFKTFIKVEDALNYIKQLKPLDSLKIEDNRLDLLIISGDIG